MRLRRPHEHSRPRHTASSRRRQARSIEPKSLLQALPLQEDGTERRTMGISKLNGPSERDPVGTMFLLCTGWESVGRVGSPL